jgi:hypothetical protein
MRAIIAAAMERARLRAAAPAPEKKD